MQAAGSCWGLPDGTSGTIGNVCADCGVREKFSQTPGAPGSSARATQHFKQHVEVDLLFHDSLAPLPVVDPHTHFNSARLVSRKKSLLALEYLRNMWFLLYGIPGEVALVAVGEFFSDVYA